MVLIRRGWVMDSEQLSNSIMGELCRCDADLGLMEADEGQTYRNFKAAAFAASEDLICAASLPIMPIYTR
jgi:hypothetical protein